jgi:hypothetical protein
MPDERTPGLDQSILPTDERRRIIAEEEFRKRVAQKIDQELTPAGTRALRVLNTPVAIWALSTIVVGLATWGYQRYTENRSAERHRTELQVQSRNELLFRLSACDRIDTTSTRDDVENLLSAVIGLRPLYKQYQGRNLPDVYLEYRELGGQSAVPPDTVVSAANAVRRATWSLIVGRPIQQPLSDHSVLPGLHERCAQLQPIREDARATLARRE